MPFTKALKTFGLAGLAVVLISGCAGRVIDLQVVNQTQQTRAVELDGWGVYNETIGRPGPGQVASYTLRVPGCRLPQEYTLEADELQGRVKVDAFTPEQLRYAITAEGIVQTQDQ